MIGQRLGQVSLLLFIATLLCALEALAYRVQPMSYDLAPSGAGTQQTLRIENTRDFPLTLEILAYSIDFDETGAETYESAEDDFLIFPPQMIIEPGASQAVRVQYVGDPALEVSKSYRIRVEQIPVNVTGGGSGAIGMAVSFSTLANIVPNNEAPTLTVVDVSASETDGMWSVTMENEGDRYARLSRTTWNIAGSAVTSEETKTWYDGNIVPPKSRRTIEIPAQAPEVLSAADFSLDVTE